MPKYTGQEEIINDLEEYSFLKDKRGRNEIKQYDKFIFHRNFTKSNYSVIRHTWSQGDKMYKLSNQYYGDMKYWWLIAMWNNKPIDSDYSYGDVVEIPTQITTLLREVTDGLD